MTDRTTPRTTRTPRRTPARSVGRPCPVAVLGWGASVPRHRYHQRELAEHLGASLDPGLARRLRVVFRGAGVRTRHSVLPDFRAGVADPVLFGARSPSTSERLAVYAREAGPLAARAASEALKTARVLPGEVTHLLFVTCTGFAAPGPDLDVMERLGISPGVRRLQIGFQGCSAGVAGIRTAAEIVRGDPRAVPLVVSVELSSLHFQSPLEEDDLRGHALFADGAGAAVLGAAASLGGRGAAAAALWPGDGIAFVAEDSRSDMTWDIGETGFRMRLSSRVPDALARLVPDFLRAAPGIGALDGDRRWAIHPGGPVILDRIRQSLGLAEEELRVSRDVLRRFGNMSSATIFFVLRELVREGLCGPGVALAFGPGLAAEGLHFTIRPETPL